MTGNRSRSYRLAGVFFSAAGVAWGVAALVSGDTGFYVPLSLMNVCVGLMFTVMSQRARGADA